MCGTQFSKILEMSEPSWMRVCLSLLDNLSHSPLGRLSSDFAKNNAIRCANFATASFPFAHNRTAVFSSDLPLLLRSPMLRFSRLPSAPLSPFISRHFQSPPIPTSPVDFIVYYLENRIKEFTQTCTLYMYVRLNISAIFL